MKSQREIEYLERFKSLPPEEKRRHFAHAVGFLVTLILEKQRLAETPALDVDIIDGECTVGGEA